MDFVGKNLLGHRLSQDNLISTVIQVQPCQDPSPAPSPKRDASKHVAPSGSPAGGGTGGGLLLSPRTVPIFLTPESSLVEDGDNMSLYSRILSARSNPGTPISGRRRAQNRSRRNSTDDEEEVEVSKPEAESPDPVEAPDRPRFLTPLPPPNFTRVFSVGGELNNILKESKKPAIARSVSR